MRRLLVIALCLALPGAASAQARAPELLRLERPAAGEWHGIYLLGKKAGWTFSHLDEAPYQGKPAVRSISRVGLRVAVGAKTVERGVDDERFYERKDGGRLLGFRSTRTGDGGERVISGSCSPERCEITIEGATGKEVRTIPHPGERLEDADPVRLVAATRKELVSTFLDLDALKVKKSVNRFAGEERQRLAGVEVAALRITSTEEGESLVTGALVAKEGGALLALTLGAAMTARPEPEAVARTLTEHVDLFALTKVALPSPLPANAREVTLTVTGLPEPFRRDDGRQSFEALDGGKVRIKIRSARPKARATLPLDRSRFEKELASTPTIDADAPAIRALAAKLVPEPKGDALAIAGTLVGWVNGALRKVYGQSSDRASLVLQERRGDCTEHSILFAALARAVGLPARTVHGLVAADVDGSSSLFWHEWVEVWAGEWVAVDPTFGQPIADATHLALGVEDSSSAVGLLGQLRVLEASGK